MKITYQGVDGAYSHIAAMTLFPNQEYIACDSFEKAMTLVADNIADKAVIPVENSHAGRVSDVHFLLPKTGLHIVQEYFLRVEHQLLALAGTQLEEIERVYSHPQALAQCSVFLSKNHLQAVANIDTAQSCELVLQGEKGKVAAIASKVAAKIYGLEIVASNIENASNNTTRFLVMSRQSLYPPYYGGNFITSLVFRLKHIPAALYKALGGFATNGINITKIESYLLDGRFIAAQFYIEVEAHPLQESFKNALEELKFFAESVNVLGAYPSARK